MPEYQPLDYRLRCHTKRTDLPVDVLRDMGEAYAEIQRLQRMLVDIKQGFEGCCNACEPVGEMNKKLREERDEARRQLCSWEADRSRIVESSIDVANRYGWDCFKQLDKGQVALDKLALLDEELGLYDMVSEANYNNDLFRKTDME